MSLLLTPLVEGKADGETLVFFQGWPDDATLWDDAAVALRDRYRIVRVNMPGYGDTPTPRWGYRTEEIVDAIVALLRDVAKDGPVTLVLHDWGCYWGHAAHHRVPELVKRVAGLDVSPHFEPSAKAAVGIVAYQTWLFGAFVIGGGVGDWMTRRFAKIGGAPASPERIRARGNYPYRNIWGDLASGRGKKMVDGYFPTCPILFVYGKNKPVPFHSQKWIDHVERAGGEIVALESGHWVPRHPEFVDVLTRWLEKTK